MLIKIIRMPGSTKEYHVSAGATVATALSQAGIELDDNETVKLNGFETPTDATLSDGDRIIVAKGAKGNA